MNEGELGVGLAPTRTIDTQIELAAGCTSPARSRAMRSHNWSAMATRSPRRRSAWRTCSH